jgi:hypothetical protein
MKKLILIVSICLAAGKTQSQDIITKTDSSKLQTVITEINQETIKYKLFTYQDGPVISLPKTEVAYVTYKNGLSETFTKRPQVQKPNYDLSKECHERKTSPVKTSAGRELRCEKLYNKKNYFGFNYMAYLNSSLAFNYMRDIKKANLMINIPFGFGISKPHITNTMYNGNYLNRNSSSTYNIMKYTLGISALFAPSMTKEVNFLMGPSFTYSEYEMSTSTRFTTTPYQQYPFTPNWESFNNDFKLRRTHIGISVGFLARFTEKLNMNLLMTYGYKQDSYNEKDPFGINYINSISPNKLKHEDSSLPYVTFAWSLGYRF